MSRAPPRLSRQNEEWLWPRTGELMSTAGVSPAEWSARNAESA